MYAHAWRDRIRQARQSLAQRVAASARRGKLTLAPRHGLTHLCICLVLCCAWSTPKEAVKPVAPDAPVPLDEATLDALLQRAAADALGPQAGAIIVLDPQTGRVRAAVNARLASEQAFPPGSAIKPFTLLTALRTGALERDARLLCRKRYASRDAHFTCSHPASLPPFTPAQALAYSCNYFFARVGERLKADDFNATLAAYGFGARTGLADEFEQAGKLPRARWHLSEALGEGEDLLVTPMQLATAYAALLNGGHLYTPQQTSAANFQPHERAALQIGDADRTLLLEGLRGAVAYGTAARAHLDALPVPIYGKTGTATEVGGVHTHGWFVGFAAASAADKGTDGHAAAQVQEQAQAQANTTLVPAPAQFKLALLVFLTRATGAQSAALAQPIFNAYARAITGANSTSASPRRAQASANFDDKPLRNDDQLMLAGEPSVRVHLVREETTRTLALEDYVYGVLAAEASTEDEYEALKALAVVSRTFALKNLGQRHARDGYDFCNLTHCQRYLAVNPNNDSRPEFHALLRRAVKETAGEVLRTRSGALINAYFSASCGGMTANVESLWGAAAHEPYERGVRDEFCVGLPNSSWTDVLPAAELARALHEDARSDVGARLDQIRVIKRDASGRAELLALSGERQRVLRGWDFKTIVGRTLGWNVLKSSRFTVERAGANFIFRGSGFGHGLGLCQMGAHAQAERGTSYRQILSYYFPATTLAPLNATALWHNDVLWPARKLTTKAHEPTRRESRNNGTRPPFVPVRAVSCACVVHKRSDTINSINIAHAAPQAEHARAAAARLTLMSEHFRVSYPARAIRRDAEEVLRALEATRTDLAQRLKDAALTLPALPVLEVVAHETTGDFVGATGQPAWAAAATRPGRIELQPLATLRQRGVLTTTLKHEYAHAVIDALGHERAPRWLAEGLAIYVAGEGALVTRGVKPQDVPPDELEGRLAQPRSSAEMRALYAAAYRTVAALVSREGEARVWQRVAHS